MAETDPMTPCVACGKSTRSHKVPVVETKHGWLKMMICHGCHESIEHTDEFDLGQKVLAISKKKAEEFMQQHLKDQAAQVQKIAEEQEKGPTPMIMSPDMGGIEPPKEVKDDKEEKEKQGEDSNV